MSNSLREEWLEVCAERDRLRAENIRLTEELADSKAYAEELRKLSVGEATQLTECRALNTRLLEESAAWKPVIDAAVAFEGARRGAPVEVRDEKAADLHRATDAYLKWLIRRALAASDNTALRELASEQPTAGPPAPSAVVDGKVK